MGLFDKIKGAFKKPEPVKTQEVPKAKKPRKPTEPKVVANVSEKEKATLAGEPYIAITKVDVDPSDMHNGSFDLDWNDKFVLNLIKAGYKQRDDDTDNTIVDRWFQVVCRNIALEVYEQVVADPTNRDVRPIRTRDLGDGRTEVS
jgi:hypothetical protein